MLQFYCDFQSDLWANWYLYLYFYLYLYSYLYFYLYLTSLFFDFQPDLWANRLFRRSRGDPSSQPRLDLLHLQGKTINFCILSSSSPSSLTSPTRSSLCWRRSSPTSPSFTSSTTASCLLRLGGGQGGEYHFHHYHRHHQHHHSRHQHPSWYHAFWDLHLDFHTNWHFWDILVHMIGKW